jgi:hypothetical protein
MREIYPQAEWIPIKPLKSPYFDKGYNSYGRPTSFTRTQYSITTRARDVDAIMRLMNWMCIDTATVTGQPDQMTFEGSYWYAFGERGHHYDIMDGIFIGGGGPGTWPDHPDRQEAAERFQLVAETDRWAGWAMRRFVNVFDTRWMGTDEFGRAQVQWERENIIEAGLMSSDVPADARYLPRTTLMPLDNDDMNIFISTFGDLSNGGKFAEMIAYPVIFGGDIDELYDAWLEHANANGYQEMRRIITDHMDEFPFDY